jgi:hypothetical protein
MRGANCGRIPAASLITLSVAALAGPPFVTDDPVPVDPGHIEVDIAATAMRSAAGLTGYALFIDANFGAAPNLQLHAGFGTACARIGRRWACGYGDTELGAKYRFVEQDPVGWLPDIAIYPTVIAPTGDAGVGLGAGHAQIVLPVWLAKDWGEWTGFGGASFTQNRHGTDRNDWFTGIGLLNKVADDLQLGGEIFHQSRPGAAAPSTTGFNLGGTWDLSESGHILFSAGRGLDNAGAVDRVSFYLAYQVTL